MFTVSGILEAFEWDCENLEDGSLTLKNGDAEIDLYELLLSAHGKKVTVKFEEE